MRLLPKAVSTLYGCVCVRNRPVFKWKDLEKRQNTDSYGLPAQLSALNNTRLRGSKLPSRRSRRECVMIYPFNTHATREPYR